MKDVVVGIKVTGIPEFSNLVSLLSDPAQVSLLVFMVLIFILAFWIPTTKWGAKVFNYIVGKDGWVVIGGKRCCRFCSQPLQISEKGDMVCFDCPGVKVME